MKTARALRGIRVHPFLLPPALALVLSAAFALPLYLTGAASTMTDALFESVSALTTTGVTLIGSANVLKTEAHLWRAGAAWIGGLGSILLFTVWAPAAAGGALLQVAGETVGQRKGRLPAKAASYLAFTIAFYTFLTALTAILLRLAGMTGADALVHSMAAVSTGGISPHPEGLAFYRSPHIFAIITGSLFLGSVNFYTLYDFAVGNRKRALQNSELRASLVYTAAVFLLLWAILGNPGGSLFLTASYTTTTGFGIQAAPLPAAARLLLFLLLFLGGSSGTGAGGVKIVRYVILAKQLKRECLRMLHPNGVFALRLNGEALEDDRVRVFSAVSLVFLFLLTVLMGTFAACLCGASLTGALCAALSAAGNALGNLGSTTAPAAFALLTPAAKLCFAFIMLAARFEFYPVLLGLYSLLPGTRSFWKR